MLTRTEPPTSSFALGPNSTPAGFNRKKLAFGMAARVLISPSIVDSWPPVTRLSTLVMITELGPVNVALSPVRTLN